MILRLLPRPLAAPRAAARHLPGGPLDEPCSPAEARARCERFARARLGEHAALARHVPPARRAALSALAAFAACADDLVDEPEWAGRRERELDAFEDDLLRAFHGEAERPLFIALADAIEACEIPAAPLCDLLVACRMDLHAGTHATWSAVEIYLRHAAAPLGQLMLHVAGAFAPGRARYAEELAIALFLARALREPEAAGRRVIPDEDLLHFDVAPREIAAARDLLAFQAARARTHLLRARPLLGGALDARARAAAERLFRLAHEQLDRLDPDAADLPVPACATSR